MPKNELLIRGKIAGHVEVNDIRLGDGKVVSVRRAGRGAPDVGDDESIIAPPLFDIQVNGAFGIDLQSHDLIPEHVHALNNALVGQGVLRWMPTLVTDSIEALEHKCRVLAEALADPVMAAHIPGIHLEGPFISPEDGPRGAHPQRHVAPPDVAVFNRLFRAAAGKLRCITLAPELPGAMRLIRAAVQKGAVVALGHHGAHARDIEAAVAAGASLCTHLGNGMSPLIHRHHNPLWPQLADDRLYASFIADLEHIPPDPLRVFARAKGAERIILTSDSVSLAGMKPGRYEMFGAEVDMKRSGRVCLAGTELLAGSSLMLLQGVWNMHRHTDLTLAQSFAAASTTPLRLFHLRAPDWHPTPGKRAGFLVCRVIHKNNQQSQLRLCVLVSNGAVTPLLRGGRRGQPHSALR